MKTLIIVGDNSENNTITELLNVPVENTIAEYNVSPVIFFSIVF